MVLALALWAPSAAHASGCTDTFTNTAGGNWSTASNWSKKAPPASEEEACITDNGTYTVTLSATSVSVKSLTIGGSSGTQTLTVESSCSGSASLGSTAGLAIGTHGAVTLTNGGLCANGVTLGGPVANAGTITAEPGTGGGARNLEGNLTNTGTLAVDANTSFNGSNATLTNEGAVDLAEGLELYVAGSDSFSNGAGGSIAATGSANVFVPSGATFNEGAGTTSGSQPVIVEQATLNYTGSGASSIRLRSYYNHLSGNISPGQSLAIEACAGGGEPAIVDAASGFSNEGSLTVTSTEHNGADCGGNDYATLDVESGTLTNTGTIDVEPGTGGARNLEGGLTNKGTLAVNTNTLFDGSGAALTNEGAVELGAGLELSVSNGGMFTNGAGGSVLAPGGASVLIPSGATFNEGAGTTSGSQPVIVEQATLSYTGSGASSIRLRSYYNHLSGSISPGQSLAIEACAGGGEPAIVDAATGFSNEGSLTVTSAKHSGADCGGNDYATFDVESGTLTNTGTIDVEPGTGGERQLQGSVTNKGTLAVNTNTLFDGSGAALTNEGAVELGAGLELSVSNGGTFTNGAGGSVLAPGGASVLIPSGATFNEGAGTTSGSQPVIVEQATLNYTGSGASSIRLRSYYDHLSGNISPGQSLAIEACAGSGNPAIVKAATGFSNEGSLTVTSAKHSGADCGGNDYATFDVESGTLTNTGTIDVEPGIGGERQLQGSVTNRGTLSIAANTSFDGSKAVLTNEGALDLAEGMGLSVSNAGSVVNGAGGNIAGGASGYLLAGSGTLFNEGAGTTSGSAPVIVESGTLSYTGSGASSIRLRSYYDHLSGSVSPGQSLAVEACAGSGNPAIIDVASGFSNEGSLTLTSAKHNGADCGGNDYVTFTLEGGTLTNTGTIATEAGTGGERKIEGSLTNDRLLSLGAGSTLKLTGSYTEAKAGTLETMIGGTSDFGALSATGSATIAGTVLARQVAPFKGESGQKFAILSAASRSGSFGHTSGATIGPDLYYAPVNTATGTNLVVLEGESPEKVPTNETKPTISGGTRQGETIVLDSPGTWAQAPGEFSYQWLRCEESGANCQAIAGATGQSYLLTAADAHHRISLQVIAYNGAGESAPAEPSSPSPVISALALHAAAGESISAVEGASVTLDGSGSTPASEIAKYRWQFGDGGEAEGAGDAILHHVYATAGKYTAQLTVFRGGEESSASVAITVTAKPKPAGGGHPAEGVYVTVKGVGDEPIDGATVLYVGSSGARIEAASGSSGEAVLKGLPEGTDTVYVYKSGLRPAVAQVTVNGEGDGSTGVTLASGEVAAAEVKSKELNYEEIVAAGINPSEPANQNVYKFVIKLAFIESPPVVVQGYVNGGGEFVGATGASGGGGGWSCGSGGCEGGGGGGGGGGGERIIAQPEVVEGHPLIQWLILHGKAAVLKQFFEVSMIVQNLSPEPFTLAKGTATLNLPEGLSLAPTAAQQSLTNEVPAVPGGGSTTTNWIIRGDTPGEYNLSADYKSTLEPFDAPVSVQAALANPLKVWGKEAMTLKVKADEGKLHEGVPYHVYVGVENKSDVPLYNVALTIEENPHVSFVFQPEQQFSELVGELKPGETFFVKRPYILIPDAESVSVFNPALSSATFVGEKEHPGENIEKIKPPTMYPLEAPASIPGYVRLKWTPVPGAEGYEVFSTKTLETLFTNTPLSVLPSSSSKTGVTVLPAGATEAYVPASSTEALWYALSTVVGGHLELESSPLVKASAPVSTVPKVSSVSPASGSVAGGTPITIAGTGFVPGATVEIAQGGGAGPTAIPASKVVVVSPTEITATTGGLAKAGKWNLFVIDAGGTSSANAGDQYTYGK
ncbi:MAG TPA: PKD domain-containing protein [Solirubrobacteraceae bacterium]|nr:PKD domain-containing protein [Solirubrobacteraceae bacterium]